MVVVYALFVSDRGKKREKKRGVVGSNEQASWLLVSARDGGWVVEEMVGGRD